MRRGTKLEFEVLEDRSVPATFGVPWSDSSITLSFAPDGTSVAGRTSNLYASLNASQSENEWKLQILQAFYAWSSQANFDVAVVGDNGARFGTPGRFQNDPRFGDIRIGGNSLASNVLAYASPPDPGLAGTLSGDVFVNTNYEFKGNPYDLFRVMLHEAGHTLGLDHSTHPNSPMYPRFNNTAGQLTAGDIAAIRALYGARQHDRHEGAAGNGTIGTATRLAVPSNYAGKTPLLAFGDLTTNSDVDYFSFDTISGRGDDDNVTVRLQTAGLSLLGAKVTIYTLDSNGVLQEVANVTSDSADFAGGVLSVTFDGNDDDDFTSKRYFIRIERAESAPFAIGKYALSVSFDGANTVSEATLNAVAMGPYQLLGANDLAKLLKNPNGALVNVDNGANDALATATALTPVVAVNGGTRYEAIGSIPAGGADRDFYRLTTPAVGQKSVLTVNVWALPGQNVRPRVAVYDATGNVVATSILVNDNGSFTVQATGLSSTSTYFVEVSGADGAKGNYFMTATFGDKATVLQQLAQGQLTQSASTRTDKLYVGQAQLFHFILSANNNAAAQASVRMTITDAFGNVVFELTARAGETVTAPSVLLKPGEYNVQFAALGDLSVPLAFALAGDRIGDPVGPVVDDPTLEPIYRDPIDPTLFLYPGGVSSVNPFLWAPGPWA
jgi:hypothetical protein